MQVATVTVATGKAATMTSESTLVARKRIHCFAGRSTDMIHQDPPGTAYMSSHYSREEQQHRACNMYTGTRATQDCVLFSIALQAVWWT